MEPNAVYKTVLDLVKAHDTAYGQQNERDVVLLMASIVHKLKMPLELRSRLLKAFSHRLPAAQNSPFSVKALKKQIKKQKKVMDVIEKLPEWLQFEALRNHDDNILTALVTKRSKVIKDVLATDLFCLRHLSQLEIQSLADAIDFAYDKLYERYDRETGENKSYIFKKNILQFSNLNQALKLSNIEKILELETLNMTPEQLSCHEQKIRDTLKIISGLIRDTKKEIDISVYMGKFPSVLLDSDSKRILEKINAYDQSRRAIEFGDP